MLTTADEKFQNMLNTYRALFPLPSQMIAFVKLWRYPCPTARPNFFAASAGEGFENPFLIRSLS
jgi:hypothetical protein